MLTKNNNLKNLPPILIVVILGFIALTGYFVLNPRRTPTSTPTVPTEENTANWKTYTNDKHNYSLKHPPLWTVGSIYDPPSPDGIKISLIEGSEEFRKRAEGVFNDVEINISVEENKEGVRPTRNWYLERLKSIPLEPVEKMEFEEAIFLGLPALKVNGKELIFSKNNKMFLLSWWYTGDKRFQEKAKNTIDQILSTFRFLEDQRTIQGKVIENYLGCHLDGLCYLVISSEGKNIKVIYHYGEWPPCTNEEAAQNGEAIKVGNTAEVYGSLKISDEISTCDSEEYYIRKI